LQGLKSTTYISYLYPELVVVQAQHLDLDFYDQYSKPGVDLTTHKEHMKNGT